MTLAEAPWCERSGDPPLSALEDGTGRCPRCGRRLRLLSSGRLRRHRTESSVVMADDGLARRTT